MNPAVIDEENAEFINNAAKEADQAIYLINPVRNQQPGNNIPAEAGNIPAEAGNNIPVEPQNHPGSRIEIQDPEEDFVNSEVERNNRVRSEEGGITQRFQGNQNLQNQAPTFTVDLSGGQAAERIGEASTNGFASRCKNFFIKPMEAFIKVHGQMIIAQVIAGVLTGLIYSIIMLFIGHGVNQGLPTNQKNMMVELSKQAQTLTEEQKRKLYEDFKHRLRKAGYTKDAITFEQFSNIDFHSVILALSDELDVDDKVFWEKNRPRLPDSDQTSSSALNRTFVQNQIYTLTQTQRLLDVYDSKVLGKELQQLSSTDEDKAIEKLTNLYKTQGPTAMYDEAHNLITPTGHKFSRQNQCYVLKRALTQCIGN